MFLEILLFFLLGLALGVVTGLIPGLHPNTMLVVILSFAWFLDGAPFYYSLALVSAMAVSNTIVNFIPSIFVGAPEPSTSLSVVPGHRFLLEGRGYEALFLTVVGGVSVMILTAVAFPFLLWFIPFVYSMVHTYIHWLLLAVLAGLVIQEKGARKVHALLFFAVAGFAGFMLLSTLPSRQVLFPALAGLFGLSFIITSMAHSVSLPRQRTKLPEQHKVIKGGVMGWLAGMFVCILPGIGSAQAGVMANTLLRGNDRDFLVALGGINTANIMFTFIALHAISKTRSGASAAISEILGGLGINELYFITMIALLSCFVSAVFTLWIGKKYLGFITGMDYRTLNVLVLILMASLIIFFSGVTGLIVAALATVIGASCAVAGIKRMYLMGFLMLPAMLYFSGLSTGALFMLGL
ncbi:MAG: tripartite tricarboxylate transporter permease [Candidatus Aenigmatarchaeota archaeon]|nr:MAG: tripartite tricarboxylate transporter permease [Candidatus Aenigmarchaeota archaeon]